MLRPEYTTQFHRDLKRMLKRGEDASLIRAIMEDLIAEIPLAPSKRDHQLSGKWVGHRDCHVRPDWVLIYKLSNGAIRFVRNGSHADLFE
jgi:mRNA interferase YafQ